MNISARDREAISHIPIWVQRIIAEVADRHRLRPRDLVSRTRLPMVVHARFEAMHRIMERGKTSGACVGRWFHRDQKTVSRALARHAEITGQQSQSRFCLENERRRIADRRGVS